MLFCSLLVISDDDVIKDGSRFHLPQVEAKSTNVTVLVESVIGFVFWVVNLGVDPFSFVSWVVDLLWLPFTLVVWVVDLWGFPFTIHLIIPVVGLLGVGVRDVLGLVPIFGFLVFWVINLLALIPILRFLCFRILDLFGCQEVPVSLKLSTFFFLVVNLHLVSIV